MHCAGMYISLTAVAVGAGGFKPCLSAFIGDQIAPAQSHLMSSAYSFFYLSINTGVLVAMLFSPVILQKGGSRLAFGLPCIAMALTTLLFWSGRKMYAYAPSAGAGHGKPGVWRITAYACVNWRPFRYSSTCILDSV